MKTSFQDGVNTIYNAIVNQGVTPANKTPGTLSTSIGTVATNKYNAGYDAGVNYTITTSTATALALRSGGTCWNGAVLISVNSDGSLRQKFESPEEGGGVNVGIVKAFSISAGEICAIVCKHGINGFDTSINDVFSSTSNITSITAYSNITSTEGDWDGFITLHIHNNSSLSGKREISRYVSTKTTTDQKTFSVASGQIAIIACDANTTPTISGGTVHSGYGSAQTTSTQGGNDNEVRLYVVKGPSTINITCGGTSWAAGAVIIYG